MPEQATPHPEESAENTSAFPPLNDEAVADSSDTLPQAKHLSHDQLDLVARYTHQSTDKRSDGSELRSALDSMQRLSERSGADAHLGEVALTAATIGAMSRDPSMHNQSASQLVKRLEKELEIPHAQVDVFFRMQRDFLKSPKPTEISRSLRAGLEFLDGRQIRHGEDTSRARVAFLASAFAATQEQSLRTAIHGQLRAR